MQMDIKKMQEEERSVRFIVLRTQGLPLNEMTWWPGCSTYRSGCRRRGEAGGEDWKSCQVWLITSLIILCIIVAVMPTRRNRAGC